VNKKNRTGLQISLVVLVLTGVLVFAVYSRSGFAAASTHQAEKENVYYLENSCLNCHVSQTPDISWYCHKALPEDTYTSRMYLRVHLDWVVQQLTVPSELYKPPEVQTGDKVHIHLFNRGLYPSAITIAPGTTVTWTNLDVRDHTLEGDSPARPLPFGTVTLKPGESISYTFEAAGLFPYIYRFDEVQPVSEEMFKQGYGKITVTAPK
jgi:plastocyanin